MARHEGERGRTYRNHAETLTFGFAENFKFPNIPQSAWTLRADLLAPPKNIRENRPKYGEKKSNEKGTVDCYW